MKLSIIIPLLNEENILPTQMASLQLLLEETQDKAQIEVIFSDSGSTDSSIEVLEKLRNSFPVKMEILKNKFKAPSISKAFQKGIELAKGELFLLLPLDCSLSHEALNKLLSIAKTSPPSPLIWGCFFKEYDTRSRSLNFSLFVQNTIRLRLFKEVLWTNAFFFSKAAYEHLEWPQEAFLEDLILCERLKKLKEAKFYILNEKIEVSARNYKKAFGIPKMLTNTAIVAAFRLGYRNVDSLKKIYRKF